MKRTMIMCRLISVLILVFFIACEREGPPKPVGTATNKHVEQSPTASPEGTTEAVTGAVKIPLEKAHQVESTLQGAEDVTKHVEQAGH